MYGKKMSYIGNIWGRVSFFCGKSLHEIGKDGFTETNRVCGEKMVLESIGSKIYYKCPVCENAVQFYDVEKIVNSLSAMIVDESVNGCEVNLTNFVAKTTDNKTGRVSVYKVLEHKNEKMRISIDDGKKD